jgi:hypothetical protein
MRLIDGSPDLWMYPMEIKYLAQLAPAAGRTIPGDRLRNWVEYQFGELERNYVAKLQEPLPVPAARPAPLDDRPEYLPGDGLRLFLARAAEAYGAGGTGVALGFKSTEAEQKRLYEDAVPELRMIHIVREPISQFASTKRTVLERPSFLYWYERSDLIATFVRRWRAHVETALDGLRRDPATHLLVRYEDLRASPAAEVHRVTEWLGIAPPAEPEVQTVLGGRHMTRLPVNPSKAGVETPMQVVADMEKQFGYSDVVSRREERLLRHCTAPLSNALGYPESQQPTTALARARLFGAWILPERWEVDLVRHRRRALLELVGRRRFVFRALFSFSPS